MFSTTRTTTAPLGPSLNRGTSQPVSEHVKHGIDSTVKHTNKKRRRGGVVILNMRLSNGGENHETQSKENEVDRNCAETIDLTSDDDN